MKKTFTLIIGSLLSVTTFSQVLNQIDSVSYLIGKSIGGNIAREMPEVNRDLMLQGLLNEINAVESLIVDDGGKSISSYFENKTSQKAAENAKVF